MQKERTQQVMKANSVEPPVPDEAEDNTIESTPTVRTPSKEQFEEAQRKTSKLHAGLFRRLAE